MPTYPVVHLEISAKDPAAASKFYGDLAGWKIEVDPMIDSLPRERKEVRK